jgi:hypothetical protein
MGVLAGVLHTICLRRYNSMPYKSTVCYVVHIREVTCGIKHACYATQYLIGRFCTLFSTTMATPGKPRQSGIPAPGRTGIPTPGRSRSVSSVLQPAQSNNVQDMSRALADAIKANDPAQHRMSQLNSQPSSPPSIHSGRRSVADRPNPIRPPERAKTPAAPKSISRPASRHSDVYAKSITRPFDVGDNVRIDSLSLEGVLRYLGEIEGKNGLWAGVELSAQSAGKGKNNGSVNG